MNRVLIGLFFLSLFTVVIPHAACEGSLEFNLTFPLLRYCYHSSENLDLFIGSGYPVMSNLGFDVYPWGGSRGFYLQADFPVTYRLAGYIPLSDFDYDPNADYDFQLIMPGISFGWKLHFSPQWFCRLGMGGSYPVNIGSGSSSPNTMDGILSFFKLQTAVGLEL